jgi:hypothetical protein
VHFSKYFTENSANLLSEAISYRVFLQKPLPKRSRNSEASSRSPVMVGEAAQVRAVVVDPDHRQRP